MRKAQNKMDKMKNFLIQIIENCAYLLYIVLTQLYRRSSNYYVALGELQTKINQKYIKLSVCDAVTYSNCDYIREKCLQSRCHLFTALKQNIGRQKFRDDSEVEMVVTGWLMTQHTN
jgi:hypothetical protein